MLQQCSDLYITSNGLAARFTTCGVSRMAASIHKLRIQRRSGNDRKRCVADVPDRSSLLRLSRGCWKDKSHMGY